MRADVVTFIILTHCIVGIMCRDVQLTSRSHSSQPSNQLFPDNNDEDSPRPQDNEPSNNDNIPNDDNNDDNNNVDNNDDNNNVDNDDYNNVDNNVDNNVEDENTKPSDNGHPLPNNHNSVKCLYYHKSYSIPSGHVSDLDYLHELGKSDTYQDCAELCCKHGPRCQLGWLFRNKCYAVGCDSDHKKMCKPRTVNVESILVIMKEDSSNYIYPSSSSSSLLSSSSSVDSNHASNSASMTWSPSSSPVTVPTSNPTISTESPTTPLSSKLTPPTKSSNKHHKFLHKSLSVAVDGNKHLTLPENNVKIFASTWPHPPNMTFHYIWRKLFGPSDGDITGLHQKIISLTNLVVGKYGLKVIVYDDFGNYGFAYVNVTVHRKHHANKRPHIIISPSNAVTVVLPTDEAILDASQTSDDGDKSKLRYQWELVSGPLKDLNQHDESWTKPLLHLQHLKIGKYRFKLTVTDEAGLMDVAYTNVSVKAAHDYPPTANAGQSVRIIHLPYNTVVLDGSQSKDDKGITKYSWKQVKGKLAETKGINEKYLHVSKLDIGLYQFELTVTDTAGQQDTVDVTIDVQKEHNKPPVAMTTGNVSVSYPTKDCVLNGSLSYDDYKIIAYNWTLLEGPSDIHLEGTNKSILRVHNLHISDVSPTLYKFQLTVFDYRNLTNSTIVYIQYIKSEQILPIVIVEHSITITLPNQIARLNGSLSHDGFGIKSYQWIRSDSSPAAGKVFNNTDSNSVLILSDLINGTYNYTLVVTNSKGLKNNDTVTLHVKQDPHLMYIIQVYIDANIHDFTKSDRIMLEEQLVIKIGRLHYSVHIQDILPHDQHILVEFYVTDSHGNLVNATVIYDSMTSDGQDFKLGKFRVIRVEEKVCQNPCSGHGYCDIRTKKCVCSTFWTQNPFTAHYGNQRSNCDWSVFYVIIVVMIIVIVLCLVIWLCCCCCLHRRKSARRRRVKYAILDHNREEVGSSRMLPRDGSGYGKNSLMVSETDTEEEVLFESKKNAKPEKQGLLQNNTIKNNLSDPGKSKNTNNAT